MRLGFGAAHVGQSLLGAQLGDGGRRGHPVVDAGRRLGQLQGEQRREILILNGLIQNELIHHFYHYVMVIIYLHLIKDYLISN